MEFLPASYSPGVVTASVLIAMFASYVALDLAKRVRNHDRRVAMTWLVGGSLTMGTGIWCMGNPPTKSSHSEVEFSHGEVL